MRVPTYQPQAQEVAAPVPQQSGNVAPAAFGSATGEAIGHAADVYMRVQEDADNLRVQDAYNQLRERQLDLEIGPKEGFSNVKGRDVMTPRENGKSLADDYMERFSTVGREIESGLANDRQRLKFRQRFADSELSFRSGLQKHETQQINEYAKTVTNATVSLETESALKSWNDPTVINKSIANITDTLNAQGLREGMPAEVLKVAIADKVSKVYYGVIASALESKDVVRANDYLKQYSKDMQAEHVLKVKGIIDNEMRTNEAVGVAEKIVKDARHALDPNDMDRLNTIQFAAESGNRQVDGNGRPITSPKGAVGIAQVMEGTGPEAAKLAGVKWDRDRWLNDKDYNKALGVAYRDEMLKRFGGDLPKALAAYNAGPGAVEKAIANADKMARNAEVDPTLPVKSWLEFLPKETQDYVGKITAQYANGVGANPRMTLEDIHAQIRQQMAGKPYSEVKIAIDHATQLYEDSQKAKKQRGDDAVSEAYKILDANGGDFTKLPVSVRSALPGNQIDNLQAYAGKRAKGIEPATDWSVYYDLRKDPAVLKTTNLIAFRHVLAESEFKSLVSEQKELLDPNHDISQTRSATQILNAFLTESGIDATPKPSTSPTSDAAKVGRAMRAQTMALEAAEKAKGRKLTPEEVTAETAKLFTKFEVKGQWFGTNTKPRFDVLQNDVIEVPKEDRETIISVLKLTKRPVTEAHIRDLYLKKNLLAGK